MNELLPSDAEPTEHRLPLADAEHPEGPWVHPPSGVLFVQGWERIHAQGCYRYDAAGRNVSVRYGVPNSFLLSAYVFPLPDGPVDAVLHANFLQSVRDMLSWMGAPKDAADWEVAVSVEGSRPLRGRRAQAIGSPPGATRSFGMLEMFASAGWVLKFRVTCTPNARALADPFMEQWLRASGFAQLAGSPSGQCG